ncbi:MAG: hypothetical protein ACRBN8_31960 [Nannocystales bacterium]
MDLRLHVITFAVGLLGGCFSADLDTDVSSVFVCEEDVECPVGLACSDGLCRSSEDLMGPSIEILGPPMLEIFDEGTTTVPLTVRGSNLELTSTETDSANAGFIEVYVDGTLVDAITDGVLENGIEIPRMAIPDAPGLHHIVLSARRLSGDRFDSAESETHVAFWVDDGEEHVGILSPAPASRIELGEQEMEIEIAALNFTFVNPGFMDPSAGAGDHEGYVHLFVDSDVPGCLPECNFDYQTSIIPQGLARVNRLTADQGLILPEGVGTIRLQIVAQTTANLPYYQVEDPINLVYDEVPVQSVLGGGE